MSITARSSKYVKVAAKGEHVLLSVGNALLEMHYEDALILSANMRLAAISARVAYGLGKIRMSMGVLHDSAEKKKPLPVTPGPAIHSKNKLLTSSGMNVFTEGIEVKLTVGPHTVGFHFLDSLAIAQFIRIRAKEAMRNAGDDRHWSKVIA